MRWEDERYIRLYTRDTVGWRMLPWQAKALLPLLMRKVDRAGLLELDDHGAAGLAHLVELPPEVVDVGLTALIRAKSVTVRDTTLLIPNFLDAQEAHASDAQRKRDQRERARAKEKLDEFVTVRDDESQNVTKSHAESHAVTPIRSVPSLPSQTTTEAALASFNTWVNEQYAKYPRKVKKARGAKALEQLSDADRTRFANAVSVYAREEAAAKTPVEYMTTWPVFCEREWLNYADETLRPSSVAKPFNVAELEAEPPPQTDEDDDAA